MQTKKIPNPKQIPMTQSRNLNQKNAGKAGGRLKCTDAVPEKKHCSFPQFLKFE
jgi:hypothetical protein